MAGTSQTVSPSAGRLARDASACGRRMPCSSPPWHRRARAARRAAGRSRSRATCGRRRRPRAPRHGSSPALDEERVLEARRARRGGVVGVVAVHEQVAADLQLAQTPLATSKANVPVPAPVTSGQAMPAAPMLACAARASDAARCDAAARSSLSRRCWAEPWYACTPAKRRPPSAARARRRAAPVRPPPRPARRSGRGRRRPRRRRRSCCRPRRRRARAARSPRSNRPRSRAGCAWRAPPRAPACRRR